MSGTTNIEMKTDFRNTPGSTVVAEIQIPVPWGHIAGKTWGDAQSSPVLCMHGLQDNASTFDRLIPLLPTSFYYVCLDLPGHGQSSHFPPGILLDYLDYVSVVKRVVDFFQWKKIDILAHSFGAQLGTYFAALYPHRISKLIMLDAVTSYFVPTEDYLNRITKLAEAYTVREKQMSQRTPPKYSYQEAVSRLRKGRAWMSELTEEGASYLVRRALIDRGEGFSFSTDQRLKSGTWPLLNIKQHMSILREIRCPQLIVSARDSQPYFQMSVFKDIITLFKRRSNFRFVVVEGNHDVHLNYPERVAPYVTKFLVRQASRL